MLVKHQGQKNQLCKHENECMLHSTNCNLALRAIELDTDLNASNSVILDLCYNVTRLH